MFFQLKYLQHYFHRSFHYHHHSHHHHHYHHHFHHHHPYHYHSHHHQLQDLEDQEEYRAASKPTMQHFMPNFQNNNDSGKQQQAQNPKGFVVRDAPWCQPPLQDNITEFPSLANLQPSGNAAFSSAWGPPKKI